jgi:cytochrome c nitrite reductase small subunit
MWYAKGLSYLSDQPEACANCHVMKQPYDSWVKGGHHHVATCNSCHVPQDTIRKWLTKAENGFHHSLAFTFSKVPLNIRARESSKFIVLDNCQRCHSQVAMHAIGSHVNENSLTCTHCHKNVGHEH